MSEHPIPTTDTIDRTRTEADLRLEQVAHLELCIKESENGFTFIGYASDPRASNPHWIIHIMEKGRVVHDTVVPRLDIGSNYTHHDLTLLGAAVDKLKQMFNERIDVSPSI